MTGTCRTALHDTRAALMQDYKLSPDIVYFCSEAIANECKNGLERDGKTLHCLMRVSRKASRDMPQYTQCRNEVGPCISGCVGFQSCAPSHSSLFTERLTS